MSSSSSLSSVIVGMVAVIVIVHARIILAHTFHYLVVYLLLVDFTDVRAAVTIIRILLGIIFLMSVPKLLTTVHSSQLPLGEEKYAGNSTGCLARCPTKSASEPTWASHTMPSQIENGCCGKPTTTTYSYRNKNSPFIIIINRNKNSLLLPEHIPASTTCVPTVAISWLDKAHHR